MQSSLLIFDDAIWHRDQNRLHPVCIVRPKTAASETEKETWKEKLSSASEDGSSPILLNPRNVPLSSLWLDS